MTHPLTPAIEALDALASPIDLFLRDDDAGWDDRRLLALLDCTERAGAPIDLAVIPQAVGDALARELCRRFDAAPHRLGLHQHGFTHANHETEDRSCEFGASRDPDRQRFDLMRGRNRLHELLGSRPDAFFTPPWNRCTSHTPALLAELGFAGLSRDRGAPAQRLLPELPVDVDWCKLRRADDAERVAEGTAAALALARAIRRFGAAGRPLGLMLHHAQMDDRDLALLGHWQDALARHPRVRLRTMRSLLAEPNAVACLGSAA